MRHSLVTKAQDKRLRKKGKGASGWERYRLAKIVVIDTETGKKMPS
jgi:hypothetical protein